VHSYVLHKIVTYSILGVVCNPRIVELKYCDPQLFIKDTLPFRMKDHVCSDVVNFADIIRHNYY